MITTNRAEIIERFAEKGYTKKDAETILDDFVYMLTELLVEGEEVCFHGFGTFSVRDSKPKELVSPITKERLLVPGHRAPRFTPGNMLKRAVKEGLLRE